jgi:alpha-ketoglutarate-dependent taurine dioxygenase
MFDNLHGITNTDEVALKIFQEHLKMPRFLQAIQWKPATILVSHN